MTTLFSQEEATRAYGREQNAQGYGRAQKENAEKMIRAGKLSDKEIAEYSGLAIEEVRKIKTKMLAAV